ncbi:MAG TPA: hypothetical protein VFR15_18255, partial [Chloroflexia bacterium]|nr:hypothetical protein [Chloroflexia bacterium]
GLPFGKYPDYAIVPNNPTLSNDAIMPVGMEMDGEVTTNAAVRVLSQSQALESGYHDMTAPDAPDSTNGKDMTVLNYGGLTFSKPKPSRSIWDVLFGTTFVDDGWLFRTLKQVDMYFVSFNTSSVTVPPVWGGTSQEMGLPVGVSRYTLSLMASSDISYTLQVGDARLLAMSVRPSARGPVLGPDPIPLTDRLPLLVTPAQGSDTLDARMKVIAPAGGGDYTATIDVYAEPWGTHPEGHYGSWSVVVPGDGQAHEYAFRFDPPARTVATERDGQPVETFAWNGPPTQGDFRAWLVLTDQQGTIAQVPLYTFALDGGRLTGVQIERESLQVVPVGEPGR